ncbi:TIGR02594 family protein [Fulvivirga sedimenti]|uniref:TIGR02594 family protein n=1 Tax=Fulvivirga sedimenti TaxID=2879465 RepID=A0A9X1HVN6_9BACT|nr:TIGR02594 family protein [Fulvivirga sedimenti]MCA6079119.1 TIGR02594 family protein [Fulvivirga sedimenti]
MENLLNIATAEIGVKEISGPKANPRILQYAKDLGVNNYTSDEAAWCSLFMNWVALKSNLERSNKLSARSWLNVGIPISNPEPGDIVIFWRESRDSWKGHVGIFTGFSTDNTRVYCLGGNQGNQVSITAKPISRVLGYRRLRNVQPLELPNRDLKRGDTGFEVVILQNALKQLGFNCGTSDGIFGKKTEQALIDFQSTNEDLELNGIFNKDTRKYLKEILKSNTN